MERKMESSISFHGTLSSKICCWPLLEINLEIGGPLV